MKPSSIVRTICTTVGVAAIGLVFDSTNNVAHASCVQDPYLASTCVTAATFCPVGYSEMNGERLIIRDYPALYSLLSTLYGGDGTTTFALPDMRGRSSVNIGRGVGLQPVQYGEVRGEESTSLEVENLASHTHSAEFDADGAPSSYQVTVEAATNSEATIKTPVSGAYISVTGDGLNVQKSFVAPGSQVGTVKLGGVSITGSSSGGGTVTVDATGSGEAFSNIPPQLGLLHCIAIDGVYPKRQ